MFVLIDDSHEQGWIGECVGLIVLILIDGESTTTIYYFLFLGEYIFFVVLVN